MAASSPTKPASSRYRTAPVPSKKMPKGIPYIVGNEAAERFSYYGMKAILVIFMTQYLMDSGGNFDVMGEAEAKSWFHLFGSAVYFFPLLGAIIADAFFGKYKTILSLSVVYCLGHLALAIFETRFGLALGLTLIAIGSGGIKPCVSAHVGDQFGKTNQHLLEKVFQMFYFSINLGSAISTLLTPVLLKEFGPGVAFGIPGALMLLATIVFWMGRKVFVHIPPQGTAFVKEAVSGEGLKAMGQLIVVYLFVAIFWALFDQTGSAWVLQARLMDLNFMGVEWLPSQIQAINPILVMIFIPLTALVIYPGINKVFPLTPLRKISIGFFLTVPAFLIPAWVEGQLADGVQVNIAWQLLSYVIITMAEVFVSITCLEFSYTQAPKKMKSLVMGIFLMSVSLGNLFTAGVNVFIQQEDVVAETLPAVGEFTTQVEKPTTLALSCGAGDDAVSRSGRVNVGLPTYLPCESASDCYDGQTCDAEKHCVPKSCTSDDQCASDQICRTTCRANEAIIESFTAHPDGDEASASATTLPVAPGTPVILKWKVDNASTCRISFTEGNVPAEGTLRVVRQTPATFVLTCEAPNGGDEASARMEVNATTAVAVRSFAVTPSRLDPPGGEATVTWHVERAEGCKLVAKTVSLSPVGYYIFFAVAMLIAAVLFIFVALWFKPKTYIQDEAGDAEADADTAKV